MTLKKIVAALSFAVMLPACYAAQPFTAATAPDSSSKLALAHPLLKVYQGAPENASISPYVHKNFSQIVEQNFARLDAAGAKRLVDNLSEKELSDLAQLYVSANVDSGHTGLLLPILATRLDSPRLVRLSHHFGYNPVYEAVINNSPLTAWTFSGSANVADLAPMPHAQTVGVQKTVAAGAVVGGATVMVGGSISTYFNYTPYEIYLDFRTAPVGALGVSGAMYETCIIVGNASMIAYAGGYAVGTVMNSLMESYTPGLYDKIGGTLSEMVDQYNAATTLIQQGQVEAGLSALFGSTEEQTGDFSSTGGDFDTSSSWVNYAAYGPGVGGDGCGGCVKPPVRP